MDDDGEAWWAVEELWLVDEDLGEAFDAGFSFGGGGRCGGGLLAPVLDRGGVELVVVIRK